MTEGTQNGNVNDINKDFNIPNKLFNKDNQNPVIFTHKDLKEETKLIKKLSLFEQDSDEDLFVKKTPKVNPILKSENVKENENLIKNIKLSRPIFLESDSDEEIINSNSTTTKKSVSHSSIDNNAAIFLDSSSDDDLFNIKSTNNKIIDASNKVENKIKQKLKSSIEDDSVKVILNKKITNESKMDLKESSINADDKVVDNEILNDYSLNSNNGENLNTDVLIIPSNQKFSNTQSTKKFNNLFSSDEEFEDDMFFNNNKSNKSSTKVDQIITRSTKLIENRNNENIYASKIKMLDSSSDEDMFNTNDFVSNKNKSDEIKNIEPPLNNNPAIINQVQKTEDLDKSVTENVTINNSNTDILSQLSDDEEGNYLSFKTEISDNSINLLNSQNKNDSVKGISSSSEEFLSPQIDLENNDIFYNSSPENLFDIKNQESFHEKQPINIQKNEIISISTKTINQNIKPSIFSNIDDEDDLSLNSKILNESLKTKTKVIHSTSNLSPDYLIERKKQELPIKNIHKGVSKINENETFPISKSDDGQLSFNSNISNESFKKDVSPRSDSNTSKKFLDDLIDGSAFSLPNSENEKQKKLPGSVNFKT